MAVEKQDQIGGQSKDEEVSLEKQHVQGREVVC